MPPTKICPACHDEVPRNRIGRPERFCSDECRREFTAIRAELPVLRADLADARAKATHWANKHAWRARASALELAIQEAEMRLAEDR